MKIKCRNNWISEDPAVKPDARKWKTSPSFPMFTQQRQADMFPQKTQIFLSFFVNLRVIRAFTSQRHQKYFLLLICPNLLSEVRVFNNDQSCLKHQ